MSVNRGSSAVFDVGVCAILQIVGYDVERETLQKFPVRKNRNFFHLR